MNLLDEYLDEDGWEVRGSRLIKDAVWVQSTSVGFLFRTTFTKTLSDGSTQVRTEDEWRFLRSSALCVEPLALHRSSEAFYALLPILQATMHEFNSYGQLLSDAVTNAHVNGTCWCGHNKEA